MADGTLRKHLDSGGISVFLLCFLYEGSGWSKITCFRLGFTFSDSVWIELSLQAFGYSISATGHYSTTT